ncbi:hypothetical protein IGI04_040883 [Brassica rapa subsp. trilocularis]|uniref:Uncharacterized protein n=1 Tax=Brassica rapa subsp. trilocularis TaxID=1813537 RepID=A0ABQ7KQQ0_BRACM|nr:hypothetical protein IGI04_040883 [Brassica rapa subsp. trilocularis]
MEPTGNSTVSGDRKPIKKTVATSATAKPNGKSTASSATVMKPNETTAVSSANSMNPNAVGAVKPEDSSASGVTQKPSPPVGSPAQEEVHSKFILYHDKHVLSISTKFKSLEFSYEAGQVRSGHLIVSAEFVFFEMGLEFPASESPPVKRQNHEDLKNLLILSKSIREVVIFFKPSWSRAINWKTLSFLKHRFIIVGPRLRGKSNSLGGIAYLEMMMMMIYVDGWVQEAKCLV